MYTFPIHQSLPSFLIVLLFFTPATSSTEEDNQRYSDCSPSPYDCGNVKLNISYPFWTPGRPECCGYPKVFGITCNKADNSSEIEIQSRKYHVMQIEYEYQTTTILDKAYFAIDDNTICLRPSSNTSLYLNLFSYTQRDLNLSFIYNCPLLPRYNEPYYNFFNCYSDPSSSNYTYFTLLPAITELSTDCQVIKSPILEKNREELEAWALGFEAWNDILKEGFEVTWSLIDPDHQCWDYVKSNGHCGLNQTYHHEFACYCNGIPHPETCPLPVFHDLIQAK
ncbi:LEAF RUST 10 DISEASE-RESISTANCE LOCUS RECEPTOR-LIKE PROTEIN KINASE-like protein 1.2 [Cinnamomum micranthum f. kanehirae]|uniref:LEAF RUST 10 DISEASE-RESISTANCE LOCUS RECEPTOR-LIKE PROTEIN KINASE-like protein 1.2 n=1 Tax=Cinnamomum micranthum f. kanehirae TaxID=337451 RepID=A0A3S3N771_9MAGN|nr:LEAF RUST 10 DISEASE-RESISTANCE LOCUS RECEPTOR-LIKE PROTEIN KINASE-like protein 1.2 [Cinnamomum micranthum f. kanehirae]